MNRTTIGARGIRSLALAAFLSVFGVAASSAASLVIDISVNNRGEQGLATVTLYQPDPVVLFSGGVGGAFSYELFNVFQAYGVDEPGLTSGEVWSETGLFFASPSAPGGTRWPFYWFALQGSRVSYLPLGDFTEEEAARSPSGHVYVPLATQALPAPGGIELGWEFIGQNGEPLGLSATVHTRLADTDPTLLLLLPPLPLLLLAARRRLTA